MVAQKRESQQTVKDSKRPPNPPSSSAKTKEDVAPTSGPVVHFGLVPGLMEGGSQPGIADSSAGTETTADVAPGTGPVIHFGPVPGLAEGGSQPEVAGLSANVEIRADVAQGTGPVIHFGPVQ
jgi:hypothetical protein